MKTYLDYVVILNYHKITHYMLQKIAGYNFHFSHVEASDLFVDKISTDIQFLIPKNVAALFKFKARYLISI